MKGKLIPIKELLLSYKERGKEIISVDECLESINQTEIELDDEDETYVYSKDIVKCYYKDTMVPVFDNPEGNVIV